MDALLGNDKNDMVKRTDAVRKKMHYHKNPSIKKGLNRLNNLACSINRRH